MAKNRFYTPKRSGLALGAIGGTVLAGALGGGALLFYEGRDINEFIAKRGWEFRVPERPSPVHLEERIVPDERFKVLEGLGLNIEECKMERDGSIEYVRCGDVMALGTHYGQIIVNAYNTEDRLALIGDGGYMACSEPMEISMSKPYDDDTITGNIFICQEGYSIVPTEMAVFPPSYELAHNRCPADEDTLENLYIQAAESLGRPIELGENISEFLKQCRQ